MVRILILMLALIVPQLSHAGFQGGVQFKTTQHENFNLANGATEPADETVKTMMASLTWFKASSKEFVWLVNAYYSYNEYEVYDHLSGSSATFLGGIFYRINQTNSLTTKIGKRERYYDNEELSLYQDDAHFITLQLSHRLSTSTLMNEKVKYEENEPHFDSNKYTSTTGQFWFDWKLARGTKLSMGYVQTVRSYDNRGDEYTFDEPYMSLSYGFARNMYVKAGYSKLKMTDQHGDRAYNPTTYFAIGAGF